MNPSFSALRLGGVRAGDADAGAGGFCWLSRPGGDGATCQTPTFTVPVGSARPERVALTPGAAPQTLMLRCRPTPRSLRCITPGTTTTIAAVVSWAIWLRPPAPSTGWSPSSDLNKHCDRLVLIETRTRSRGKMLKLLVWTFVGLSTAYKGFFISSLKPGPSFFGRVGSGSLGRTLISLGGRLMSVVTLKSRG